MTTFQFCLFIVFSMRPSIHAACSSEWVAFYYYFIIMRPSIHHVSHLGVKSDGSSHHHCRIIANLLKSSVLSVHDVRSWCAVMDRGAYSSGGAHVCFKIWSTGEHESSKSPLWTCKMHACNRQMAHLTWPGLVHLHSSLPAPAHRQAHPPTGPPPAHIRHWHWHIDTWQQATSHLLLLALLQVPC